MPAPNILTIRLPVETRQRLADLSRKTRRLSNFLAVEAIAVNVTREISIVDAILAGEKDVRHGRLTPQEFVVKQVIAASRHKQ